MRGSTNKNEIKKKKKSYGESGLELEGYSQDLKYEERK